jgi:hypothetical protein
MAAELRDVSKQEASHYFFLSEGETWVDNLWKNFLRAFPQLTQQYLQVQII